MLTGVWCVHSSKSGMESCRMQRTRSFAASKHRSASAPTARLTLRGLDPESLAFANSLLMALPPSAS